MRQEQPIAIIQPCEQKCFLQYEQTKADSTISSIYHLIIPSSSFQLTIQVDKLVLEVTTFDLKSTYVRRIIQLHTAIKSNLNIRPAT